LSADVLQLFWLPFIVPAGLHRHASRISATLLAIVCSRSWRITFRFVGENATDLNLEDYN